jgi:peptidyl-prolyl cis-trans isomerase C
MYRFARTTVAAVALALAGPLAAQDAPKPADAPAPTAETVIATVNGKAITLGNMLALRADLPEQYQTLPDEVLFKGILDQLVQQAVLSGMLGQPTPVEQLSIDNQKQALEAGLMVQRLLAAPVTEEQLQAAYETAYQNAEPEKEYHAAHILVETEDEAKAIVEELKAGGDFAAIAKDKSLDPGSGANGGDLGWFNPAAMVPEFGDAVIGATVGEVTGPVKSNFGWHIIKVEETRVKDAPPLDDVKAELTDQIRNESVEAAIAEATEKAQIDRSGSDGMDPSVISKLDLLKE